MKNSLNPRMRDGDEVKTEWSQASYEAWCRENAAQFITFPEKRVVDLYKVVRSVIENDFSPVEKGQPCSIGTRGSPLPQQQKRKEQAQPICTGLFHVERIK